MLSLLGRLAGKKQHRKPATAASLLGSQKLSRGIVFSIAAAVVAMMLWIYISMLFDRYFPWVSVLQGALIGMAMQRYGQGLDWRFAVAAVVITAFAAVGGSFLVALFLTGREFGTGALALVDEISMHTLKTFLVRDFGAVGTIYMSFAAALAAFLANRRLLAGEAAALRRYQQAESPGAQSSQETRQSR